VKPEEIIKSVQDAGVVGAGGAGFPTHVKLAAKASTVIVNMAECEPLLRVDQLLGAAYAQQMIAGLSYAMEATGATEGIIATKEKYEDAVSAIRPLLKPNMRIAFMQDVYPAGDEFMVIKMILGDSVPPGGIPINIEVVVSNVQSLINVAGAIEGRPVITRTLTITGEVSHPMTVEVPVGVGVNQLLEATGNRLEVNQVCIEGGPIMGKIIDASTAVVTKTTGGLVILSAEHPLIKIKTQSMEQILRIAKTVCEQCQMCTDLCPRNIIGHRDLKPHMSIRAVNYGKISDSNLIKGASLCSDCGVCELYACPVNISPRRVNQAIKQELARQGVKYDGKLEPDDPVWSARLVPSKRIAIRMGLKKLYYLDAPLGKLPTTFDLVKIPLKQHVGAPCVPVVSLGETVAEGQLIGTIPEGQLGANLHASIQGIIAKIDENAITIQGGRMK
jgi:Na+-translocating ferredoxin:NAD+ oxidoreductase RnfC subunit